MRPALLAGFFLSAACTPDGWSNDDDTTVADDDSTPVDDDSTVADDDTTPADDDTTPGDDDSTPVGDDDSTPVGDDDSTPVGDDDTTPNVNDQDGDGYDAIGAGGDDCNDVSPAIHPGAPENPSGGVDDDCDGVIDEEIVVDTMFPDDGIELAMTVVDLWGSGFDGIDSVEVDGVAAVQFEVLEDTHIFFVTPASHAVGTAEVVLASPWQSLTLGTLFTYTGDDSALPEGELLTTDWVSVTVDTASPPWQASLAVPGVTDLAGEPASIDAEIGYGYQALQPGVDADWWWLPATWVQDDGPGDRWEATLTLSQLGTYNVTFRFTDDGGLQWQYVDGDPATPLDWMEMGTIDVNP